MFNLLVKWARFPGADRMQLLQAAGTVLLVRLALKLFPLPVVQSGLRRLSRQANPGESDPQEVERLAWAVSAAGSRLLPDGPCLTQALALQYLFLRRGLPAELCIGVAKDEGGALRAHAWVESAGEVVIGGPAEALKSYQRLPQPEGEGV